MRGQSGDEVVIDGMPVTLLDPATVTPVPEVQDARRDPDGAAAAATVVQPSGTVMSAVGALWPAELSEAGLIDAVVACERLKAALEAKQAGLNVAHASVPSPLPVAGVTADEFSLAIRSVQYAYSRIGGDVMTAKRHYLPMTGSTTGSTT